MAAPRRYYPGFFGALFLILLRIAIGWHFLYEGTQKILSTPWGKASILGKMFPAPDEPPFSAEGYLRGSTGPLAPKFRELVSDVYGREKLKLETVLAELDAEKAGISNHYGFDADQLKKADEALQARKDAAEAWFRSAENRDKIKKYLDKVDDVEEIENNREALSYQRATAWSERKAAEADRRDLVKEVDAFGDGLLVDLAGLAKPEQAKAAGPYEPPMDQLQKLDLLTMWGLSAVGLCLMLGLFTPLAALGGAAYLLSFYLSMPPWPGLPESPKSEGHYRFVNKNLIEMLACLVLASTPNGLWIGVDALLFGWIGRGKRPAETSTTPTQTPVEPRPERPASQDRRKYKKR